MRILDLTTSGGGGSGTALELYAGSLPGGDGSAALGSTGAGWALSYRIEISAGYGPGSTVEITANGVSVCVHSGEDPILLAGDVWIAIGAGAVSATIAGSTIAGAGTAGLLAT